MRRCIGSVVWQLSPVTQILLGGLVAFDKVGVVIALTGTDLPAPFDQALEAQRASVLASGNDPEAMRKLAHLYQANRLFAEMSRQLTRDELMTIEGEDLRSSRVFA